MIFLSVVPAFLSAFAISVMSTWLLVVILQKKRMFVAVKPELLFQDQRKSRTPFFGGIAFLVAVTACFFIFMDFRSPKVYIPLFSLWVFSIAGFCDDVLKLRSDNGDGFTVKQKSASQIFAAVLVVFLIIWKDFDVTKSRFIFGRESDFGIWYVLPAAFFLVFYVNALNITDGVDGLASCSTIPVLLAISLMGWETQFGMMPWVVIGTLGGFLVFNHSPARIFMGDVGSHGLAGLIGAMALLMRKDLLLLVCSILFCIELLSSLIQILSIRILKKKVFAIAPLHHLLEHHGMPAWKIVLLFTSINVMGSLIALAIWRLS